MSDHRRLSVTSQPPRKRGTPAYQVRRNPRAAIPGSPEATSATEHPGESAPSRIDTDQRHGSATGNGGSTSGTEALPIVSSEQFEAIDASERHDTMPAVSAAEAEPAPSDGASTTPPTVAENATCGAAAQSDPDLPAPTTTAEDATDDTDADYAEYARSVEEAAARSRLELAPQAAPTAAYPASAPNLPDQRPLVRQTRGRPVMGSRVQAGGGDRGKGGRGGTRNGDRERDPRPLLKRPKTWFVIVAIVVAAVAIGAVLWAANIARITYTAYNDAHVEVPDRNVYTINPQGTPEIVPTEQVQASLPNWDNQDPFNVLLMGIDNREGDTEPPRSDTMIVMRINPATKQVAMMSIPRDLMVYIPAADRWDKINAAYPIGEEQAANGGPPAVMETIEANFDVRIHYFVTVDFEGFRKIVDTVGGVIIDVQAPIKDDQYPTETLGLTREYFATGLQKMDGEAALRYSRTRHNDNDIARGDRQQQMLVALRDQAMNLGLISKAEELIRQMGDMVKTDFNFNQLLALANLGRNMDPNSIAKINLWDAGVLSEHQPEPTDDAFYFEADWPKVQSLMDLYFSSSSTGPVMPTPTVAVPDANDSQASPVAGNGAVDFEIPIVVQNDAAIPRLASAVGQIMTDAGFNAVSPETGSGPQAATVIYDYAESPETARYVADRLGLDASAIVYSSGGNGIVISVGSDVAWALDP